MLSALALFMISLLGAEPTPDTTAGDAIRYHVKLIEMNGLDWRETTYSRMQRIAQRGSNTIWIADRHVAQSIGTKASQTLLSPQLLAGPNQAVSYAHQATKRVASHLTRYGDGPVDHADSVAYAPKLEEVGDGYQFTVAGRRLDQGTLIRLAVSESRLAAIHRVKLTEYVSKPGQSNDKVELNPHLDVPEVLKSSLEGEWLIADDQVLVASLGAHTVADAQGKAVVLERLVLVEAVGAKPASTPTQMSQATPKLSSHSSLEWVLPNLNRNPIPMPARVPQLPSRSLPQPRLADGSVTSLPPLPEPLMPPNSLPGTSEPCATPQTLPAGGKHATDQVDPPRPQPRGPAPVDVNSQRAGFEDEDDAACQNHDDACLDDAGTCCRELTSTSTSLWSLLEPERIRLPESIRNWVETEAKLASSSTRNNR